MNELHDWVLGFVLDYQVWATFIAATIGFAGIIFTLVVQRNFDLALDRERTEAERRRLIAAVATELVGVREFAREAFNHLVDTDEFLMPRVLPFFVFEALASKVDLLSPLEIQSVRHCYAWLREIPARAVLLQPPQAQVPEGYVLIPPGRLHIVRSWYSTLDTYASHALRELKWELPT